MKAFLIIETNNDELANNYRVINIFHRRPNAVIALSELAKETGLTETSSSHYTGEETQLRLIEVEFKDDTIH